ncbi:Esa1p-associated factor [Allomyces arbusculus]|nr:Esa1p-associated factor [Allomyces arbusculus]
MSDELSFEVGQKVLCYHGPLIYEAKVKDKDDTHKDEDNKPAPYYIHYQRWASRWDEWVTADRLLPVTEENIRLQFELQEKQGKARGAPTKRDKDKDGSARGGPTKRGRNSANQGGHGAGSETDRSATKRRRQENQTPEPAPEPEIPIPLPDMINVFLVEDFERVTKKQQLVPLPRKPSVKTILTRYRDEKLQGVTRRTRAEDLCTEVTDGLLAYFDRALGALLLYRFERQQYVDAVTANPDKTMSELYGGEHLLRLMVQLPTLIAQTKMDQDGVFAVRDQLVDFIRWFAERRSEFLLDDYENPDQGYINMARSH